MVLTINFKQLLSTIFENDTYVHVCVSVCLHLTKLNYGIYIHILIYQCFKLSNFFLPSLLI